MRASEGIAAVWWAKEGGDEGGAMGSVEVASEVRDALQPPKQKATKEQPLT